MQHRKLLLFSKTIPGKTRQDEPIHEPFPLPSLPRQIQKHSVGLGLYFRTLQYFIAVMLLLSGIAVYPVYFNVTAGKRTDKYTLITASGEKEFCPRGYEVRLDI
jgi:hypothetical protein